MRATNRRNSVSQSIVHVINVSIAFVLAVTSIIQALWAGGVAATAPPDFTPF